MSKTKEVTPSDPVQPKQQGIVLKGTREFVGHKFRLNGAECLKDLKPYRRNYPELVTKVHSHIFHSVNDKKWTFNTHSTPMAGHTHAVEIEWNKDAEGNDTTIKSTKCGPPLEKKYDYVPGREEPVTTLAPIEFGIHPKNDKQGRSIIPDDHVHELEYLHTEILSALTTKNLRAEQRALMTGAMDMTKTNTQAAHAQKTATSAAKAEAAVDG